MRISIKSNTHWSKQEQEEEKRMAQQWVLAHTPQPPAPIRALLRAAARPRSLVSGMFVLLIMMMILGGKGEAPLNPAN